MIQVDVRIRALLPVGLAACSLQQTGLFSSSPTDAGTLVLDAGSLTDQDASPLDAGSLAPDDSGAADDATVIVFVDAAAADTGFDAAASCTEPGARVFGGHCYFPTTTGGPQGADFDTLEQECEAASAHMVTINSAAENTAVQTFFAPPGSKSWIGMHAPDAGYYVAPSEFVWITGEPITVTYWVKGQPPPAYSTAACSWTSGGTWTASDCSFVFGGGYAGLCERE